MKAPIQDTVALVEKAKAFYNSGELIRAGEAFSEAGRAYQDAGDGLMAAEMKNNQCIALLRAGQPKAALQTVEGTELVFLTAGDFRRLGIAQTNRAMVLEALKRPFEAIDEFEKAGESLEKAGEDQMRVQVMQLLATLYFRRLKFINAVIALQSGLAGVKEPTPRQRLMKMLLFLRV